MMCTIYIVHVPMAPRSGSTSLGGTWPGHLSYLSTPCSCPSFQLLVHGAQHKGEASDAFFGCEVGALEICKSHIFQVNLLPKQGCITTKTATQSTNGIHQRCNSTGTGSQRFPVHMCLVYTRRLHLMVNRAGASERQRAPKRSTPS